MPIGPAIPITNSGCDIPLIIFAKAHASLNPPLASPNFLVSIHENERESAMPQNHNQSNEKADRIRETANQFARQTGGTFVEVPGKRSDFDNRERVMAANAHR